MLLVRTAKAVASLAAKIMKE